MGLALALAVLPARAQEEDEVPRYDYALDEQTELTLTSHPKDPKTWTAELRAYGEPAQGQILSFNCEVKQQSKDLYLWKGEPIQTGFQNVIKKEVRIAGQPGDKKPLEVSTRSLTDDFSKPARIHGSFKLLNAKEREARVKKRFEQADAALADLLAKTLTEAGKAGEAKLKKAHQERLDLRMENAGGRDAEPNGVAYWNSMWTGTLDAIGFLRSYTGKNAPKGFAGSYRMANGNSLELEVVPEGLRFTISVRNPTDEKPGSIAGMARLFTNRANYKEPISKGDAAGPDPAELVFTQHGHIVHVEGRSTQEFSGKGVSFDGDYYKVVPRK